ncbi:MAG: type VI secretion system tube protein Hcp [Ferruginibacter sp.]
MNFKKILPVLLLPAACFLFLQKMNAQVCWVSGASFIVGEGPGVHSSESPVLAIEDFMSSTSPSSGTGTASFTIGDLKFKAQFNKSSIGFLNAFKSGQNIASISFKFWYQRSDASNAVWTNLTLENAMVNGYKILGPECNNTSGCNIPLLEISISWRKMTVIDDFGNTVLIDKQQLGL